MYRTCAFCNSKLDGDGGPSGLGVGRRLAFDEWKSRLWVICPKCSRWNMPRRARWMYTGIVGRRAVGLVGPPICERCGSVVRLRAKHMAHARVVPDAKADLGLVLSCPSCHSDGAMLTGPEAQAALRQG